MLNLNNFRPVYDADELDRTRAPPRSLHVDINAPTEDVYIPTMDELLQTPPLDSRAAAMIAPRNENFNWDQAACYEPWFHRHGDPSTQGEAVTTAGEGGEGGEGDEGDEGDEVGE